MFHNFGWNKQAKINKRIKGNFNGCYRFSVDNSKQFEPSNGTQQFKI